MRRFLSSVIFSICLVAPVGNVVAQDHPMDHKHEWNDGENNAWHQYLKEQHRKDHDWAKATKREQDAYWKWRDQHRDIH